MGLQRIYSYVCLLEIEFDMDLLQIETGEKKRAYAQVWQGFWENGLFIIRVVICRMTMRETRVL